MNLEASLIVEARRWATENKMRTGIFGRHKVKQDSDGSWTVNNRREEVSYFKDSSLDGIDVAGRSEDGVIKSALVSSGSEGNSTASDIWNSPLARAYIPDKVSLSFSSSVTAFAGTNTELSFNWITRGHDAQIIPYAVMTVGGQAGPQVSATI